MSSNTPNLNLLKKDPVTDGDDTFNIDTMLNENWDKIDAAVGNKVDKVSGKQLSTNDYTTAEKNKLAGITTGAGGANSATDTVIGNRTIVDTTAPVSDTGTITSLLSGLAFQIKSITGAGWKTASTMTIAAIKALLDAATNAATASTLIKRDASGRAQVAAPSAAADIARKDTVDTAQAAAISAAAADATTKANAAAAASVPLTQKGAAGGVVPLNSSVKIDETYLPDSIVGQVEYQSTWNASTNVPTLPAAAAAKGWYYVVATAGTYSSID
ncbi:hypothetical protein, partial [Paenibacillus graminis]|uniref:hypothetical protein n=1 Tax=Paenibacillus graminis TaxID=189425 RepID=UPI002DBA8DDF